jgi:hypothetical protein
MLKMKLELDALKVESFMTSEEMDQLRGTVEGLSRRRPASASCFGTCLENTCQNGSCPDTCASCDTYCLSCDTLCGGGSGGDSGPAQCGPDNTIGG